MHKTKIAKFGFKVDGRIVVDPAKPHKIVKDDNGKDVEVPNPFLLSGCEFQSFANLAEFSTECGGEVEGTATVNRIKRSKSKNAAIAVLKKALKNGEDINGTAVLTRAREASLLATMASKRIANERNSQAMALLQKAKDLAAAGDQAALLAFLARAL